MSEPIVILKRDVIRSVRARWSYQYPRDDYTFWDGSTAGEIRPRLAALDLETCSSEDVDKAIGSGGWADNRCDHCGEDVEALVRFGERPNYEARWQDLCLKCLVEGVEILRAQGSPCSEGEG